MSKKSKRLFQKPPYCEYEITNDFSNLNEICSHEIPRDFQKLHLKNFFNHFLTPNGRYFLFIIKSDYPPKSGWDDARKSLYIIVSFIFQKNDDSKLSHIVITGEKHSLIISIVNNRICDEIHTFLCDLHTIKGIYSFKMTEQDKNKVKSNYNINVSMPDIFEENPENKTKYQQVIGNKGIHTLLSCLAYYQNQNTTVGYYLNLFFSQFLVIPYIYSNEIKNDFPSVSIPLNNSKSSSAINNPPTVEKKLSQSPPPPPNQPASQKYIPPSQISFNFSTQPKVPPQISIQQNNLSENSNSKNLQIQRPNKSMSGLNIKKNFELTPKRDPPNNHTIIEINRNNANSSTNVNSNVNTSTNATVFSNSSEKFISNSSLPSNNDSSSKITISLISKIVTKDNMTLNKNDNQQVSTLTEQMIKSKSDDLSHKNQNDTNLNKQNANERNSKLVITLEPKNNSKSNENLILKRQENNDIKKTEKENESMPLKINIERNMKINNSQKNEESKTNLICDVKSQHNTPKNIIIEKKSDTKAHRCIYISQSNEFEVTPANINTNDHNLILKPTENSPKIQSQKFNKGIDIQKNTPKTEEKKFSSNNIKIDFPKKEKTDSLKINNITQEKSTDFIEIDTKDFKPQTQTSKDIPESNSTNDTYDHINAQSQNPIHEDLKFEEISEDNQNQNDDNLMMADWCPLCSKEFPDFDTVLVHLMEHHELKSLFLENLTTDKSPKSPHRCIKCSITYRNPMTFCSHILLQHPQTFVELGAQRYPQLFNSKLHEIERFFTAHSIQFKPQVLLHQNTTVTIIQPHFPGYQQPTTIKQTVINTQHVKDEINSENTPEIIPHGPSFKSNKIEVISSASETEPSPPTASEIDKSDVEIDHWQRKNLLTSSRMSIESSTFIDDRSERVSDFIERKENYQMRSNSLYLLKSEETGFVSYLNGKLAEQKTTFNQVHSHEAMNHNLYKLQSQAKYTPLMFGNTIQNVSNSDFLDDKTENEEIENELIYREIASSIKTKGILPKTKKNKTKSITNKSESHLINILDINKITTRKQYPKVGNTPVFWNFLKEVVKICEDKENNEGSFDAPVCKICKKMAKSRLNFYLHVWQKHKEYCEP